MGEVIIERLKNSIGKKAKIYLNNGFRFAGEITNCDNKFVEVLDDISSSYKLILLTEIKDAEVEE